MAQLSGYLKNIFYGILILVMAPPLLKKIAHDYTELLAPRTTVGVVPITGSICKASEHIKTFKTFFEDKQIRAILIKMDCPGGAAGSSQAIFNEVKELKKMYAKPVIVLVENVCASGGYYIASAADAIVATPSAFVGSIGAYIAQPQLKAFIDQFKIKYSVTKTGTYKAILHPLLDISPEEQALLQGLTDDTYQQFISDVAEQRPQLTLSNADAWANGKIFTGNQALKLGLIDAIGSWTTAEHLIRQKAPIEGKIHWEYPPKKPFLSQWIGEEEDLNETYMQKFASAVCTHLEKQIVVQ